MKSIQRITKILIVLFMMFGVSQTAYGKRAKRKGQLLDSIRDAMDRSDSEQNRIRNRQDDEANQRVKSWKVRKLDSIEIKHTGASSAEPVDLGDTDFSYDEVGVDQSGLDSLHSDVVEESVDINFDEELREVSSKKD